MRAVDEDVREAALERHLASLRAHVKALAGKSYQDVLRQRTLDIVLLFVPNEAAFHAALSRDAGLYEEAFRQGVVLCSPTTLLAALQLVGHVWRSEKQNANAQKIAEEAGRLLEKLSAFVGDLDGVGTRLTQAQDAFATARAKLATGRGNVLKKAADIAKLGARVKGDKVHALLVEAGGEEEGDEDVQPALLPTPRTGARSA
jgi:DNA recombination protein RmuC